MPPAGGPPPPPPPPPPPLAGGATPSKAAAESGEPAGQNALFAAIEARKAKADEQMRKIASGEAVLVDPRAAREEELKKQTAAKLSKPK